MAWSTNTITLAGASAAAARSWTRGANPRGLGPRAQGRGAPSPPRPHGAGRFWRRTQPARRGQTAGMPVFPPAVPGIQSRLGQRDRICEPDHLARPPGAAAAQACPSQPASHHEHATARTRGAGKREHGPRQRSSSTVNLLHPSPPCFTASGPEGLHPFGAGGGPGPGVPRPLGDGAAAERSSARCRRAW